MSYQGRNNQWILSMQKKRAAVTLNADYDETWIIDVFPFPLWFKCYGSVTDVGHLFIIYLYVCGFTYKGVNDGLVVVGLMYSVNHWDTKSQDQIIVHKHQKKKKKKHKNTKLGDQCHIDLNIVLRLFVNKYILWFACE